jgi:hypothetical protein
MKEDSMNPDKRLSDCDNLTITNLVARLMHDRATTLEKVQAIFNYVRDEIKLGFLTQWDDVKASEIVYYGMGQCSNKATLFVALCLAAGIPARIHAALIDPQVMHAILPGFAFPIMPRLVSHAYSEVQLNGEWKPVDSYILDKPLYEKAITRLQASGRQLGYGIALLEGKSSCEFNFGELGFVQMGGVREDHGVWEDASQYHATDKYVRFNTIQKMGFPVLVPMANRNVTRIRQAAS